MYPPLKEIFDKYPAYLKEHRATLSDEDLTRYEKQFEVENNTYSIYWASSDFGEDLYGV